MDPKYTPGMWESMRMLLGGVTRMTLKASSTMERGLNVMDITFETGEDMAKSTQRVVGYSTMGKEADALHALVERYPHLEEVILKDQQSK